MNPASPLSGRRLLAVFAHPDDEAFSAAGTIAMCTRLGAAATIVCATRGESGRVRGSQSAELTSEEVGRLRCAELAASCAIIGAGPPRILDLPDGRLQAIDTTSAAEQIAGLLTDEAPEVVITLGTDGAYGHGDHLAVTALLDSAVSKLEGHRRPRVLHAAFPRGLFAPVWRALRRLPGVIAPDVDLGHLGIEPHEADLVIDLGTARRAKIEAIGCHQSQLTDGDVHSFLRPGLIAPLLEKEWFTVRSGPAMPEAATHPFAGLS